MWDNKGWTFPLNEVLLRIVNILVRSDVLKLKHLNDGFVSYKLFGLSFWRHPFAAEDPLVSKWYNATFLQICSNKETNSSTSRMAWVNFQQIFIFGWTIP